MRILLLAGEESGVFYARLLQSALTAMRRQEPMEFRGYGDWGFETGDLAVMGFLPVLKKLFFFINVARVMKRAIARWRPDVVVTIDYPGLNLKLAAFAKKRGIPSVHLVCPQVWAWHRSRVPKIASSLTRLLCFFPFEPAIFARFFTAPSRPGAADGFKAEFIGHPLVDVCALEAAQFAGNGDKKPSSSPMVALLPGSRVGEIERIFPRQLAAAKLVLESVGTATFVVPAASLRARRLIEALAEKAGVPGLKIVNGRAREVLRAADAAAVASGTATLEAALVRVPTVLCYATSALCAWIVRYFVTGVRFLGLANIIAERCAYGDKDPPRRRMGEGPGRGGAMPELLQDEFTAPALAQLLAGYISNSSMRSEAVAKLDKAMALMRSDGKAMETAARAVFDCAGIEEGAK